MNWILKIFAQIVKDGKKKLEDVPENIREEVKQLLDSE